VARRVAIITDIVDIKPVNMEELTEVITATEFHPSHCNLFMYSSSKANIKLADMRDSALCDKHAKCEYLPCLVPLTSD
jgi:serine/threonine-protein phosphatase 2A regulatory subunit B